MLSQKNERNSDTEKQQESRKDYEKINLKK